MHSSTSEYNGLRTIDYLIELIRAVKESRHAKKTNDMFACHDLNYIFDYTSRLLGLVRPGPAGDHVLHESFVREVFNLKRPFSPLGKLSPKEEAAGKLRIFALVDS